MSNFIFLILAVLGALFILDCFLVFWLIKLKKRLDIFLRKGEKDLGQVLLTQMGKIEKQEQDVEKIFRELLRLGEISRRSIQKIGLVRFNPFKEVGSNQSFSVALLDSKDNGVVITSLYGREANRTYAKPIKNGVSSYLLSGEEKEAIEKAKLTK